MSVPVFKETSAVFYDVANFPGVTLQVTTNTSPTTPADVPLTSTYAIPARFCRSNGTVYAVGVNTSGIAAFQTAAAPGARASYIQITQPNGGVVNVANVTAVQANVFIPASAPYRYVSIWFGTNDATQGAFAANPAWPLSVDFAVYSNVTTATVLNVVSTSTVLGLQDGYSPTVTSVASTRYGGARVMRLQCNGDVSLANGNTFPNAVIRVQVDVVATTGNALATTNGVSWTCASGTSPIASPSFGILAVAYSNTSCVAVIPNFDPLPSLTDSTWAKYALLPNTLSANASPAADTWVAQQADDFTARPSTLNIGDEHNNSGRTYTKTVALNAPSVASALTSQVRFSGRLAGAYTAYVGATTTAGTSFADVPQPSVAVFATTTNGVAAARNYALPFFMTAAATRTTTNAVRPGNTPNVVTELATPLVAAHVPMSSMDGAAYYAHAALLTTVSNCAWTGLSLTTAPTVLTGNHAFPSHVFGGCVAALTLTAADSDCVASVAAPAGVEFRAGVASPTWQTTAFSNSVAVGVMGVAAGAAVTVVGTAVAPPTAYNAAYTDAVVADAQPGVTNADPFTATACLDLRGATIAAAAVVNASTYNTNLNKATGVTPPSAFVTSTAPLKTAPHPFALMVVNASHGTTGPATVVSSFANSVTDTSYPNGYFVVNDSSTFGYTSVWLGTCDTTANFVTTDVGTQALDGSAVYGVLDLRSRTDAQQTVPPFQTRGVTVRVPTSVDASGLALVGYVGPCPVPTAVLNTPGAATPMRQTVRFQMITNLPTVNTALNGDSVGAFRIQTNLSGGEHTHAVGVQHWAFGSQLNYAVNSTHAWGATGAAFARRGVGTMLVNGSTLTQKSSWMYYQYNSPSGDHNLNVFGIPTTRSGAGPSRLRFVSLANAVDTFPFQMSYGYYPPNQMPPVNYLGVRTVGFSRFNTMVMSALPNEAAYADGFPCQLQMYAGGDGATVSGTTKIELPFVMTTVHSNCVSVNTDVPLSYVDNATYDLTARTVGFYLLPGSSWPNGGTGLNYFMVTTDSGQTGVGSTPAPNISTIGFRFPQLPDLSANHCIVSALYAGANTAAPACFAGNVLVHTRDHGAIPIRNLTTRHHVLCTHGGADDGGGSGADGADGADAVQEYVRPTAVPRYCDDDTPTEAVEVMLGGGDPFVVSPHHVLLIPHSTWRDVIKPSAQWACDNCRRRGVYDCTACTPIDVPGLACVRARDIAAPHARPLTLESTEWYHVTVPHCAGPRKIALVLSPNAPFVASETMRTWDLDKLRKQGWTT